MRKLIGVLCLLIATSSLALAQDQRKDPAAKKALTAEEKKELSEKRMAPEERMAYCKAKTRDMKGDERKNFMECLEGKSATKKPAQQEKVAACNKEADTKGLKGDDRRKFMRSCVGG